MEDSESLLKAIGANARAKELLPFYKHRWQQANISLIKILVAKETLITPQHPGRSKCGAWTPCGLASIAFKDCGWMDETYKKEPFAYWEYAIWLVMQGNTYLAPSQDSCLDVLVYPHNLRQSNPWLMMSFFSYSIHLSHGMANHKPATTWW